MAFKKAPPPSTVPDSPERLILDLPRRKIPDVLPHQSRIMRSYANETLGDPDVALQLPTGSGKTLVGLLLAEWLRRKNRERVVYLCPTKQLVNQVVEQGEDKYGLTALGFTGSARDYDASSKAEYQSAERIAVTTYSSLFNTRPFFSDPDVIIVDDAHAAESYISEMWSLRVERGSIQHSALHAALCAVVGPRIDTTNYARLLGSWESAADRAWVDKIPTPLFMELRTDIAAVFDVHAEAAKIGYSWSLLKDHLHACQMYLSSQGFLIRPLISPTWTHAPFEQARQRLYMSATLGAGGDLERIMGRKRISRIPTPEGWDRQGVGRRFFIFPGMSLADNDSLELRRSLMRLSQRSLVLVPSEKQANNVADDVSTTLGYEVFRADDIELSKKPFVRSTEAVAVVANRYDGIDFPGNECRLLFIEGLPKATNLQERFLMSRMGANLLFNERVQTRILQAIGRCTRSLEDYSAVVVSGDELPDYLADLRRRKYFHPELQAEIEFGVNQSMKMEAQDILENFQIFLGNGPEWESVNEQIVAARQIATQIPFPAMSDLEAIVSNEIEYQRRIWQSDFESALAAGEAVLARLDAKELRGYRALWHYLSGSVAYLGNESGVKALGAKSRAHFAKAKEAAKDLPWLVSLARYQSEVVEATPNNILVAQQIERIEAMLSHLGTLHERSFAQREREILEGIADAPLFEVAHKNLGELLGFHSGKVESDGSPDPWWILGDYCFVFEDHAGASLASSLDVTKARQVASHPAWMKANVPQCANALVLAVLITPVKKMTRGAGPHLEEVAVWPLEEFRAWATQAVSTIRKLRRTFFEAGDLLWRSEAAEELQRNELDASSLYTKLMKYSAAKILNPM